MDLHQRLRLLTKLVPEQPANVAAAPVCLGQDFELPAEERSLSEPTTELAALADACLLAELKEFDWRQVAFIDTETTGLSTGTGTYVILLGIGTIFEGSLRVRQYFLPEPAAEDAFWQQVLPELQPFPVLCTFNGKSYDLPLINTRLTLMRLPPLAPQAHLDLLYPARRLWRRILPSCALQSLEQHRLHSQREDDLPGALIPSIYYDYLKTGDRKLLQGIFLHNRRDVFSLMELALQMAVNCAQPQAHFGRAEEFFGLAEAHLRNGQTGAALDMIGLGLARPGDQRLKRQYLQRLAKLHTRLGEYEQAEAAWSELAALEPLSPTAQVELAKLYEHRQRNLSAALRAARQALAICRRRESMGIPAPAAERAALAKRLQRLERRWERAAANMDLRKEGVHPVNDR
ncbi:MAG: ribonuclease H-like domain-containing protein [Bacillota bacterium]|jgi:uncharacterized protein YprB with RNaseH-like and TPR domain